VRERACYGEDDPVAEVLIAEAQIQSRVAQLGEIISRDYAGKDLVIVGVLTGAFVFLADLVRSITVPLELDFVATSSYGAASHSSGEVRLLKDRGHPTRGKPLLLTEDIIDTGLPLRSLLAPFDAPQPASIACCVLLDKPTRRVVDIDVAYRGFRIEDRFVVGYGLDFAGRYRNLPYIGVLRGD
jgi:hypoxanthine phosphoribosyltransferase